MSVTAMTRSNASTSPDASPEPEGVSGLRPRVTSEPPSSSTSAANTAPSASPTSPPASPSAPPRNRARLVFVALLVLASLGSIGWYSSALGHEQTDDAQIEGHLVNVAPRVPGQVAEVLVTDNQLVHAGDPLVRLDTRDLEARLLAARADHAAADATLASARAQLALTNATVESNDRQARGGLVSARAGLTSSAATIRSSEAAVEAARSRVTLAQSELSRVEQLFAQHTVAQAELDARQAAHDQAVAALAQAEASVAAARTGRATWIGQIDSAEGRVLQAAAGPEQVAMAQAGVAQAEARVAQTEAAERLASLQLEYTTITAPITGYVSRRTVEPGATVSPERAMLAIVGTEELWVVANFKEDQIAHMREGQPVEIEVDAFGGQSLHGHIESLAGATGARFSLIPPDNASGNFTKVVQRVPVRIAIDDAHGLRLVPGLSVTTDVRVDGE